MGDFLSTPSPNPSETQSQQTTMSSKDASQAQESQQTDNGTSEAKTLIPQVSDPPMEEPKTLEGKEPVNVEEEGDQEEEEEGECGFCLFMKGGGCRDSFTEWEKCIEEAEKNKEDIVDKCFEVTGALKKCMEAHTDYYAPILQAEKAAEEEAVRELEKEKAKESESSTSSPSSGDSEEEKLSTKKLDQDGSKGSETNEGA